MVQNINFGQAYKTGHTVSRDLFGTNSLADVNTDADGNPTAGFIDAVKDLNISNLRFPGGTCEGENDILAENVTGQLSPQTVNFLNWVQSQNANGAELSVTLGIPTKRAITYQEVYEFAQLVAKDYADVVNAIEIGSEYSIGADTITEATYGARADIAARALADGFTDAGISEQNQPDIVLQMAEIFGGGSDYAGSGQFVLEDGRILGKRVMTSTLILQGTAILGDFQQLLIANFGGVDLVVDPYTAATSATVKITMHAMDDLAVRHATAFNVITITAAP